MKAIMEYACPETAYYNYEDLNDLEWEVKNDDPQHDTLILGLKGRFGIKNRTLKNILLMTYGRGYIVISGHAPGEGGRWVRFRKIISLPPNYYDLSLDEISEIWEDDDTDLHVSLTKLNHKTNDGPTEARLKFWPPQSRLFRAMLMLLGLVCPKIPSLVNTYKDIDPMCEVKDDGGTLQLHIPGFSKEQVSFYITECGKYLRISGHKPCESGLHDWIRFVNQFEISGKADVKLTDLEIEFKDDCVYVNGPKWEEKREKSEEGEHERTFNESTK
ncbi:unnamed protein product [Cuscuta campestris]|uniref:SHSP domain-containing protein n=1 Tax=Cuscuta campestris TaxID=132261 RepID=A0A484NNU2_9ASTE|nr:unnamed protein product [Cuscuta campestris]